MGKKKAVEPPPPPPASWSETLSAYTAYFTDSASEMLHSVTGRSRGGISSPPANKKKKQTNVKKAKPAAPTKKKQQQRPEKGGSKKRGADVAPAVSSTTVLIDTLHKYSDGVKTLAANSTVRAQQLSQTAGAHARAAKTRALDTSRRSTARVGQALGRDDLHEHAAAGVVALAILVAAILYWLYPRLRGSWGGDSTKTGREGGGLVSPDAAAVAAVPEGDEPSSATADEAALAEVPSAGETADRDSSSGSVAGVKGTIPKRLGGDSVVDAPSPAFGGDLGVGVVGTEALAAELADEAVAGAGGEIDAVGGGNVSVASDAATAGTDVDIEARVASVEEPVVDAVAAAVAAALGGVTGAAEDVVPDVDVALDDVVVTAPVKVELEASAAPAVVMVADKGDTAAVSGGATLEGVPLETEAPMPGTDEEATAGTSRTLTAAAESRSAEKSDRKVALPVVASE